MEQGRRHLPHSCLLATGLILLLQAWQPAHAWGKQVWRVTENRHFIAYSDASDTKVRKLLAEMEKFRIVVQTFVHVKIPADAPRTNVVIFDHPVDFMKLTPRNNIAGFTFRTDENRFFIVMPAKYFWDNSAHDIRHEYVHVVTGYYKFRLPRWYNEGLAEYMAAVRIKGNEIILGMPPKERAKYAHYAEMYSYDKLLDDQFNLNKPFNADAYIQFWLLTSYMLSDPEQNKLLAKHITLYNSGMDTLKSFKLAFGMTPDELYRRKLLKYARHVKEYVIKFDFPGKDTRFSSRAAGKQELDDIFGILHNVHWNK